MAALIMATSTSKLNAPRLASLRSAQAVVVLFDLPNYIVLSTYVLLMLVWAECFLESRYHTFREIRWRRTWLISYMIFNVVLYGGQVVLYLLLFLPIEIDYAIQGLLFAMLTVINFFLVVVAILLYFYMNCKFSGFPFKVSEYPPERGGTQLNSTQLN